MVIEEVLERKVVKGLAKGLGKKIGSAAAGENGEGNNIITSLLKSSKAQGKENSDEESFREKELELREREIAIKEREVDIERKGEEEAEEGREEGEKERKEEARERKKEGYFFERNLSKAREKASQGFRIVADKMVMIIFIILIIGAGTYTYSVAPPLEDIQQSAGALWDRARAGVADVTGGYQNYLTRLNQISSGDYAKGVQDKSTKDLGVKIENLKIEGIDGKLVKGQTYGISGTLNTKAYEKDQEGTIQLACKTREDKKEGTLNPDNLSISFASGSEIGFQCILPEDTKVGTQYVDISATYPFITEAYKNIDFGEASYVKEMSDAEKKRYEEKKSVFTGRTVQIGLDIAGDYPLKVVESCDAQSAINNIECEYRAQLTIGKTSLSDLESIEKIKKIEITLFDGLELVRCTGIDFEKRETNTWGVTEDSLKRLVEIKKALTTSCLLRVTKYRSIIKQGEEASIQPHQIQIITEYNYKIKRPIQIKIKEAEALIVSAETGTVEYNVNNKYLNTLNAYTYERKKDTDRIVLHHSATSKEGSAKDVVDVLRNRKLSIHYIIDRNGQVYSVVPENKVAWHAGCSATATSCVISGMNDRSIGIEIVNSGKADDPFEAAYENLKKLIEEITKRNNISYDDEHIISHYEISKEKWDPGPHFDWAKIGLPNHNKYFALNPNSCPIEWEGDCPTTATA